MKMSRFGGGLLKILLFGRSRRRETYFCLHVFVDGISKN